MHTGLIRRSGRYSTRRVIPLDLQTHFGRREIVRALGTADPAEARKRHVAMWQTLDKEFEEARSNVRQTPTPIIETPLPLRVVDVPTHTAKVLAALRRKRDRYSAEGRLDQFYSETKDSLSFCEGVLSGDLDDLMSPSEAEAMLIANRAILTGEGALAIDGFARQLAVTDDPKREPTARSVSLAALVDRWASERQPTQRTVGRTRNIVDRFEAVVGKLPVQQVRKAQVLAFKDDLVQQGQSPANINVMIGMLGVVFNYAVNNDLIAANPASGVKVADNRKAKDKRREFTAQALNAIFSSPVFANGERPIGGGGEAAYWLPLLALYTGARQTELGQLHPDDIVEEEYRSPDGAELKAWVIRVVENAERDQQVKTEGSERRIPIHGDLLALGFLKLVAEAKAQHRTRLFHQIKPSARGELMATWSKWFGRYRRKVCGITNNDTPFHSFRHSFVHYARLSGLSKEISTELTGHERGDVADDYGGLSYPLAPLVEGMARYRVPGLSLPPAPPPYRAPRR